MTVFDWIDYLGKIDPSILGEFSIQNRKLCAILVRRMIPIGAIMV
jgi:hypothetical protein